VTKLARNNDGEIIVTRPGLYVFHRNGLALRPAGPADEGSPGFLVSPLGDFVVSPSAAADAGHCVCVTLNGRAPLGRLERLTHDDVIELRPVGGPSVNRSCHVRFMYREQGPPIRFVLPRWSAVRCAYSMRPLAGETAVRCARCSRLYHEDAAWHSDVDEVCPKCGWSWSNEKETP